jgi:hypothetical protein
MNLKTYDWNVEWCLRSQNQYQHGLNGYYTYGSAMSKPKEKPSFVGKY